jgi:hypothetical protein
MTTLSTTRIALLLLALASVPLFAEDVPLTNWTVPPYHRSSSSGGITTMTDLTPGIGFVGVAPCRLVDTRQAGFPAGYGQPALAAGAPRNFDLNSQPNCAGIPAGVDAYSLNFTVTNTQGPGFLKVYPQGGSVPLDVSTIKYVGGQTIANAAIVPAGTNGGITVIAGVAGTDVIIDINGYFPLVYNAGNLFVAVTSNDGGAAILGQNNSGAAGSHGIGGFAAGAGVVHGVQGQVGSSALAGSSGVHGITDSTGIGTFGVLGETTTEILNAAGVFGRDGAALSYVSCCDHAGVRGDSKNGVGVFGRSEGIAVFGLLVNSGGTLVATGLLGYNSNGTPYGVYSGGDAHVGGTLTANTKMFVQPHPYDPSKEIRYVSLEGPHSEIYFRGTAEISQGVTRIPVPEHFRFVATPGSYSTLVTPVGGMASVAVLSEGEDGIVVQASRNVQIHYVVYAERESIQNPDPIAENVHFRPDPLVDVFAHLPDSYRRLMIQNGTLNPDGTVNVDTARRLGWDKASAQDPARIAP